VELISRFLNFSLLVFNLDEYYVIPITLVFNIMKKHPGWYVHTWRIISFVFVFALGVGIAANLNRNAPRESESLQSTEPVEPLVHTRDPMASYEVNLQTFELFDPSNPNARLDDLNTEEQRARRARSALAIINPEAYRRLYPEVKTPEQIREQEAASLAIRFPIYRTDEDRENLPPELRSQVEAARAAIMNSRPPSR
jgi:cytoskeletal protein RodZ